MRSLLIPTHSAAGRTKSGGGGGGVANAKGIGRREETQKEEDRGRVFEGMRLKGRLHRSDRVAIYVYTRTKGIFIHTHTHTHVKREFQRPTAGR